jgi:hypothetical protein
VSHCHTPTRLNGQCTRQTAVRTNGGPTEKVLASQLAEPHPLPAAVELASAPWVRAPSDDGGRPDSNPTCDRAAGHSSFTLAPTSGDRSVPKRPVATADSRNPLGSAPASLFAPSMRRASCASPQRVTPASELSITGGAPRHPVPQGWIRGLVRAGGWTCRPRCRQVCGPGTLHRGGGFEVK